MVSASFPQKFGPYVLERFIAAGGMAEVFLARRADGANTGGPICVKRMLPEMSETPEYVTMFRDEASLSKRLVHPNIVRVLDFGEHDGRMYMAMEYIDGLDVGSLQKRLRQKNELLGVAHALKIGIDLCAGLAHAHSLADERGRPLKLIHRDVSPQNILISSTGAVKVTDFGIAKAIGRETRTETGLIKGKIAYMAPEQALGKFIDQRLDQFAAGIVVWEMVTGQRLYAEKTDIATFEKIIRKQPAKPSELRASISTAVDEVVLRALAKAPDDRFADVAEFGAALTRALAHHGGPQKADLGAVMTYVMGGSGHSPASSTPASRPAIAAPAPQQTGVGARAIADAATRLAPKSDPRQKPQEPERLPTAAMMPLPAPQAPQQKSGNTSSWFTGSDGGEAMPTMDATLAMTEDGAAPLEPPRAVTPQAQRANAPANSTRVTGKVEAAPAQRALPVGLLVGALAVGVVAGFSAAKVMEKPASSSADCAVPSANPQAISHAAEAVKRGEDAWAAGDRAHAVSSAKEANATSGSAAAHMLLGRIALKSGDRLDALSHFRCVVALDPTSDGARDLEKMLNQP